MSDQTAGVLVKLSFGVLPVDHAVSLRSICPQAGRAFPFCVPKK
ncbi:hypothetical Protein YC6258_00008 [Gynuella sunshinyii YC6258]|uniref:Uncharacterized protein n=1 Tax=Gynuella sunshinyii YC6258 TaxID=1445510 RepID=A0A0C5VP79_9GAMM|nr:hypothetical Protein YC6258_00008 [Gynuella sunshinyii YC6258]